MIAFELTDRWRDVLASVGRIALVALIAIVLNAIARRVVGRIVATVRSAAKELDRVPGTLIRAEQAQRAEARARTLSSVLRSLASVTIFLIALLVVLGELDINLAPLIAGAGVASIAVGFGAQSLVRDVVAGIFVLLEDQYGVGDTIDAGVANGQVEHFTLRATRLRDAAGTVWHVPNGIIERVGNKSQNWARAVVDVVVPMDADVRAARSVFVAVAEALAAEDGWAGERISGVPDDQGVQAFGASGVTLRVVLETEPAAQWVVERELRLRVKEAFDEAGIVMATQPPPAQIPPPPAR
ncbi:MAG: mechanosensitive ion channel family protein [Microthrixaceae bacterium]|nr:mechanosensitive ion channel family protein [Microthrixaceae bacterium]